MTDAELKVFERLGNKEFKIKLLEKEGYRLSDLEKDVIMSEDFTLKPYEDEKGIWTNLIGKAYIDPNDKYTIEDGIVFMRMDLKISRSGCEKGISNFDKLTIPQQEALIEMAYNLGVTGLVKGFPKMIKHIENEDWLMAQYEAFNSKWAFDDVKRTRACKIIKKLIQHKGRV